MRNKFSQLSLNCVFLCFKDVFDVILELIYIRNSNPETSAETIYILRLLSRVSEDAGIRCHTFRPNQAAITGHMTLTKLFVSPIDIRQFVKILHFSCCAMQHLEGLC